MKRILLLMFPIMMIACSDYKEQRVKTRTHTGKTTLYRVYHCCGHPTKKGAPCKRRVKGTSGYCWQHR